MSMSQLQKQVQKLQNQLGQIVEEQEYNYSVNKRVKLIISDSEFITNTKTLSNQQHGNTLFHRSLSHMNSQNEGNNNDEKNNKMIEMYFDRDPELFIYILNYLRGYNLKNKLHELTQNQLEKLKDDTIFYKISRFQDMIIKTLYGRFNPYLCSPLMECKQNCRTIIRSGGPNNWNGCVSVYGILKGTGSRYVEVNYVNSVNGYMKLGVTEATSFKTSSFPGWTKNYPGCIYHFSDGALYRNAAREEFGEALDGGDRIGILVKLNEESNMATIGFYKNGKLMREERNLRNYMNVSKGVLFVVALYNIGDQLQLVQNPQYPQ